MKLQTLAIGIVILVITMSGCDYNKSDVLPDCATVPARFATDVFPLIQNKCATVCHNVYTTNAGGPFTNYAQIKNKADLIKFMVETRQMPQVGTLTEAEIKIISCWVDAGAENN
ncbi:MAG: hypothetical protein H7122_19010 [Chitinophagaceae bacterium]|nr:hypothetical protein [Chitinophagaceae bacterium]